MAEKHAVELRREQAQRYVVTNDRGAQLRLGSGADDDFTPVELLLAAIAGCSAIDVDILTARRAEPDSFRVHASGVKVRDADGNHLTDPTVTFHVSFPAGEAGDAARALLPTAVRTSHDRLCTVSRTVELATPVTMRDEA